MAVALLLSLALVTYSNADHVIAQELSLDRVLHPEQRAQNALGIIGAWIARLFVPSFLGYNILILSSLAMVWGYVVFRGRKPEQLPFYSIIGILFALSRRASSGGLAMPWKSIWKCGAASGDWVRQNG